MHTDTLRSPAAQAADGSVPSWRCPRYYVLLVRRRSVECYIKSTLWDLFPFTGLTGTFLNEALPGGHNTTECRCSSANSRIIRQSKENCLYLHHDRANITDAALVSPLKQREHTISNFLRWTWSMTLRYYGKALLSCGQAVRDNTAIFATTESLWSTCWNVSQKPVEGLQAVEG